MNVFPAEGAGGARAESRPIDDDAGDGTMAVMIEERGLITVGQDVLDRVRALYSEGDCLGAYEVARAVGPLGSWTGTAARVLAGRLARHLGGFRLGTALHLRAWRADPTDPEACYYHARAMIGRRGPLAAWEFLRRVGPLEAATDEVRSDWLASHAIALGALRDFDAAEAYLTEAERVAPGRAWLRVERSSLFEMEDRYDEALAAAREALALRPWYIPAVQATAGLLQLLDREAEAVALLTEASDRLASGAVSAQLATVQFELGRFDDAMRSLDRFAALAPLIDPPTRRWLAGRRSDAAYRLGDLASAVAFARECGEPFFKTVADRIEAADVDDRRVRLAVGFVRQHHQTCGPATLSALARFWGREADHLEVAGEICYDGTPDHLERSWAEANGWTAREFTVTWDSALALLDRGVPFTLTTVETQSAHLQAVIGYDARRGTLLIRDPTLPHEGEALGEPFLKRYRSVGPRGMAMVPRDRAELFDGLDLPESNLYDHLNRMQVALRDHDREAAAAALEALRAEAPGHRLTHHARRLLAIYDVDAPAMLSVLEALRAAFPDDVNLRLSQLSCLRELGRRDDRLAIYREACAGRSADPILCRQYAQELLTDAREHPAAERLARRALRARPADALGLYVLARIAWDAGRLDGAIELYRFASCLEDKNEGLVRSYFSAARHVHREDEPLKLMAARCRRFGAMSSQPARTFHEALSILENAVEAAAVLDEALRLRPDDGELILFAAEADAMTGEFDRAAARLDEARGHCRRGDWLRAAAGLASNRGDLVAALGLWREVLEAEPAVLDANRAVARLLAETEDRSAALAHLTQACERSPHNYALNQALIERLRAEGSDEAEPALRRLLDIHPADAWGRRELALFLGEHGSADEAAAEMEIASAIEPLSTVEASVRGIVLEHAGRLAEAREAYREAIRRDIDNESAVSRLIETCDSQSERLEALAFIESELARQVTFGDGLLAFARRADGTLGPDDLLATLLRALEARPDLWHAWSAVICERIGRGDLDEADALARQAVERFPLLPRLWLDRAAVCRARCDRDGEHEALGRALRISPGWGTAARELSQALEREGKNEESRAVLERAAAYSPLDAVNHGYLADTLWLLGEKEAAVERMARSLRIDPGYEWAWRTLAAWSRELERPEATAELAREVAQQRRGDSRAWLALARMLSGPETLDERLEALDRAAALAPRSAEPHDLKAEVLAESGRFDEAEAACRPPSWGDRPPLTLRGRAAWIAARRGDLAGAVARMRPVLDENPGYYWGWNLLVEWVRDAGSNDEYLEATEGLVRVSSDDAVSHAYRGEALLRAEDSAGAKLSFRRALELAPSHEFAAMNLFDLELADGEIDAARTTLEALKTHGDGGAFVISREVQWHVARAEPGDRVAAREALERLCLAGDVGSEWPFRAAVDALTRSGWGQDADSAYAKALERPDAASAIGMIWAERWGARRDWRQARKLPPLLAAGGESAHQALAAYIKALGQARRRFRLSSSIRRHRASLRGHAWCWGMVGYALTNLGRNRAAVRWLADWPDRADVEPWMLVNLVISFRALGRDEEAARVSRRALELPASHGTSDHILWLALDDLLEGRADEASRRLDGLDPAPFDATKRYLYDLALILRDVERAEPAARRRAAILARRDVKSLNRKSYVSPSDFNAVLSVFRRAARRLAHHVGPWRGRVSLLEFCPPNRA
ncbi:MAG: tetratricopeptide repeat protein [Paludisphaera borealis]|uniref:C39 family peptidase n=1 Tax=Paludisphaera borealis TaxID=1387353 RepID=UPI00284D892E|nr:tetratricopeptide repeat protein [Paludisphaera borealis]MDR3617985.1 tetratricopeptide repeat protein [Paludisphaera borealis]